MPEECFQKFCQHLNPPSPHKVGTNFEFRHFFSSETKNRKIILGIIYYVYHTICPNFVTTKIGIHQDSNLLPPLVYSLVLQFFSHSPMNYCSLKKTAIQIAIFLQRNQGETLKNAYIKSCSTLLFVIVSKLTSITIMGKLSCH